MIAKSIIHRDVVMIREIFSCPELESVCSAARVVLFCSVQK